jgi:hypothetical protein
VSSAQLYESGEPFADTPGERDYLLALVTVECLLPGGGRLVAAAGGFEHLGQVATRRSCQ